MIDDLERDISNGVCDESSCESIDSDMQDSISLNETVDTDICNESLVDVTRDPELEIHDEDEELNESNSVDKSLDGSEEINCKGDKQLFSDLEVEEKPVSVEKDIRSLFYEDKDTFSYVSKYANTFRVESIPVSEISKIKDIIDGECYVSSIPTYRYEDIIFGYKERLEDGFATYIIYSTEYSFEFRVPMKYRKDSNDNIRDYLNQIIKEYPIKTVLYTEYEDKITIEDYSVLLYGMLNISTTQGDYVAKMKDEFDFINFYSVLLYFRNVVDQGNETISTGCIKKFFDVF